MRKLTPSQITARALSILFDTGTTVPEAQDLLDKPKKMKLYEVKKYDKPIYVEIISSQILGELCNGSYALNDKKDTLLSIDKEIALPLSAMGELYNCYTKAPDNR